MSRKLRESRARPVMANLLQRCLAMSNANGTDNYPILVVDDETDLVATYERVLRRKGYRVISAGNLNDGLTLAGQHPLLLLVTDIRLPDGDGLDLIRAVRRLPKPPPAIVMTGFASQTLQKAALAAGAAEYLAKPFALSTFTAAVEKALAKR